MIYWFVHNVSILSFAQAILKKQNRRGSPLQLVVATGKAPGGEWIHRTIPKLGPAPQPGVFMQGAVVKGPEGSIIYTRDLPRHIIETVVKFGKEHGKSEGNKACLANIQES